MTNTNSTNLLEPTESEKLIYFNIPYEPAVDNGFEIDETDSVPSSKGFITISKHREDMFQLLWMV